jgi:DNA-directed RNA polymerase specialized sigma24 family protein
MSNFPATRWSSVIQVAALKNAENLEPGREKKADQALEALCNIYWVPIYAYARLKGKTHEEAQDLTQTFFLEVFRKSLVSRADRSRTKFRTFLLAQFDYVLANEWRSRNACKRGRGFELVSFDFENVEEKIEDLLATPGDPATVYDQVWARQVVDQVLGLLEVEYTTHNQDVPFADLKGYLPGGGACERLPYERLAAQHPSTTAGALKVRVSRLNKRFRELLLAVVADTLANPQDPSAPANPATVEEEIRYLVQVLSSS